MSSQWRWVKALVDALVEGGIRTAVLSPGSRSTPLVVALASDPRVECEDLLDERSAGFYALGQARVEGRPSLLVCTSGSAAAHYFPAVIEASHASIPLLILSADRPFELHHAGANQTVDQTKLFGDFVRHFADLGEASETPSALRAVRRAAVQAVSATSFPRPGPVHLNVHLKKPLEPPPDELARVDRVDPPPRIYSPRLAPSEAALDAIEEGLRSARRPLLVAGPLSFEEREARSDVFELARAVGMPLAAEATSQLRFVGAARGATCLDHFEALYRTEMGRRAFRPDFVLSIGAAPSSAAFERMFGDPDAPRRIVVAPYAPSDPQSGAAGWVFADVRSTFAALRRRLEARPVEVASEWARSVERVDAILHACASAELEAAGEALTEGAIARAIAAQLPEGALLSLGNSLSVRQMDLWAPGSSADVAVLSQRGASGIDGLISGAAGAARRSKRPLLLLLGDVSFLHDVGGLLATRGMTSPLVIVVVQNDGGRIFEQLPIGGRHDLAAAFSHFTTPHGLSFEPAAALFGTAYAHVSTVTALRDAVRAGLSQGGTTIVEAVVPPSGAATQNARFFEAARRALEGQER